ncbi:hypothetical protein SAMN05216553_102656 [Lentzea fradiae]|uniref:Uncharacterized protein n=1 Tax=Lentzea fradiae TaxID=200378 RepID=A0A1G7N3C7_9PSEU|nr:hypothetical protein [Lentzea fradiae]SDF68595.1 hypothetical protein SAMN05216553_102656 [Lentzea fradiae]
MGDEIQVEQQYEYFAIVTDARPLVDEPFLVCRRQVDDHGRTHDEAFTMRLAWEPSTALRRAETGEEGEAHRVDVSAATRFEQLQRARERRMEPEDGRYNYAAWIYNGSLDDPDAVIRFWTSSQRFLMEERYAAELGWVDSYLREDWQRGRYDGKIEPIDKATADQIIERWEQRGTEQG